MFKWCPVHNFQVSWLLRAWLKCLPTCLEASSMLGSTRTDSSDQAVMPLESCVLWNVRYPIGSGRVTFSNAKSYMKAVAAAFIEIKTVKFTKKVQVDPYLEDALCSCCFVRQGPYFCRWKLNSLNLSCRILNAQGPDLLQLFLPRLLGASTWLWSSPPPTYHEEHQGRRQHWQVDVSYLSFKWPCSIRPFLKKWIFCLNEYSGF